MCSVGVCVRCMHRAVLCCAVLCCAVVYCAVLCCAVVYCAVLWPQRKAGESDEKTLPWLGYAAFHLGDYRAALDFYKELLSSPTADPTNHLYAAACLFHLAQYKEARDEVLKGPETRLQNRILMHAVSGS